LFPRPTCFFAYDPGDEYGTLATAACRMLAAGFTRASHRLRCYVLIGWPRDTFAAADQRLNAMLTLGFTPMAMLWRHPNNGLPTSEQWRQFQRRWARPAIIHRACARPFATAAIPTSVSAMSVFGVPRTRGSALTPLLLYAAL